MSSVVSSEVMETRLVPGEEVEACEDDSFLAAVLVAEVTSAGWSRTFGLERGTKQGDPVSPALFNAVLENMETSQIRHQSGCEPFEQSAFCR